MSPTPALLARLTRRASPPPARDIPLVERILPAPAITWAEQAREADVLGALADLTAIGLTPLEAAQRFFGGDRA